MFFLSPIYFDRDLAAARLAERLGARNNWTASHNSDAFRLSGRSIRLALGNWLAFWKHEEIGIPIDSGVDVIALAFAADAYSRTYRSKAITLADRPGLVRTKRGLELVPDQTGDAGSVDHLLNIDPDEPPVQMLDSTLAEIERRYGKDAASFVALQLEYSTDRVPSAR